MQSLCAYETAYIGQSDFCYLFTQDEWAGFENSIEIKYYYDFSYGSPIGRAQGIGYVQELIARLKNEYITSSNSSVNSTFDPTPIYSPSVNRSMQTSHTTTPSSQSSPLSRSTISTRHQI